MINTGWFGGSLFRETTMLSYVGCVFVLEPKLRTVAPYLAVKPRTKESHSAGLSSSCHYWLVPFRQPDQCWPFSLSTSIYNLLRKTRDVKEQKSLCSDGHFLSFPSLILYNARSTQIKLSYVMHLDPGVFSVWSIWSVLILDVYHVWSCLFSGSPDDPTNIFIFRSSPGVHDPMTHSTIPCTFLMWWICLWSCTMLHNLDPQKNIRQALNPGMQRSATRHISVTGWQPEAAIPTEQWHPTNDSRLQYRLYVVQNYEICDHNKPRFLPGYKVIEPIIVNAISCHTIYKTKYSECNQQAVDWFHTLRALKPLYPHIFVDMSKGYFSA